MLDEKKAAVRHATVATSDEELIKAKQSGTRKRGNAEFAGIMSAWDRIQCRLHPKFSFFFDGTGNSMQQEMAKPQNERALSNIAKLFRATIDDDKAPEAFARYISGVGTPFHTPHAAIGEDRGGKLGLGFGAGGDLRLNFALFEFNRILNHEYSPTELAHVHYISLAVFGFSRGATLARAFVRRLLAQCEPGADGPLWTAKCGKKVRLRVIFMGLFDTVASVGGPGLHMDWGAEQAIPPEVERCVHFVSGHEVRQAFPLDSVRVAKAYPANCEEVVYPGVHSDVGGGYAPSQYGRSNLLSRIPLRDMYAEALRSGVLMKGFPELSSEDLHEFALDAGHSIVDLYNNYQSALSSTGSDLESLILAHRRLLFRWRGALHRAGRQSHVLGTLYREVDVDACLAAPAAKQRLPCPPTSWKYALPKEPGQQARQLIAEHHRLVQRIEFLRNPLERQGDAVWPRPLTSYEQLILAAWDEAAPLSEPIEALLSEHVHDSVAHFNEWPCALHDPRGIYCDVQKYYVQFNRQGPDVLAAA